MILFQAVIQGSWLLPAVKSYGLLQIWSQPDQGKRDGAQHRRIDFQAWKWWILFPLTWFLAMPSCKGGSASVQEERGMDFCGRSFLHMSFKLSCLKKKFFWSNRFSGVQVTNGDSKIKNMDCWDIFKYKFWLWCLLVGWFGINYVTYLSFSLFIYNWKK